VRSCSIHQAKSSKAEASNSKLLNDSLERKPGAALRRGQKTRFHGLRFQQVCSFPFRSNLPPQFDRHDDGGRFPSFIGDDLNVRIRHDFSLPQPILDNPRFVEPARAPEEPGRFLERGLRDEADQFAFGDGRSPARGFLLNRPIEFVERDLREIGQIHGYLGAIRGCQVQSHGLDEAESAGRLADFLCNLAGDFDIGRFQIHVVGDQEVAGAHHDRARGRMHGNVANIGRPAIETLAPDVL